MMEAVRTSETSVDIQLRTRQYIPEYSELHTRRRENLKSQTLNIIYFIPSVLVNHCEMTYMTHDKQALALGINVLGMKIICNGFQTSTLCISLSLGLSPPLFVKLLSP
jgi:hypothetical protein